jgi:hypothetical protein
MLVYRFENDKGQGPWWGNAVTAYDRHQRTRDKYHSCGDMPAPSSRLEGAVHDHWSAGSLRGFIFGFASLDQLKAAFRSGVGRAAMGAVGQRLKVFEVPDGAVFTSPAQCIFERGDAVQVGELDLRTLKPLGEA